MCEIFLCDCPAHFPFSLARHTWFVCQKGKKYDRYEILWEKDEGSHLHKNNLEPFEGISYLPYCGKKFFSKGRILAKVDGNLANEMRKLLESSVETYPCKGEYKILGPNSNSYTAWILSQFPDFPYNLGVTYIGKNFIL